MGLNTIYLVCAVAGGTILVLRIILMMIGIDQGDAPDVSVEADVSVDGVGAGLNFLSLQSIAGFFTMFGLVGLGLLEINVHPLWSMVGALAAGVFTAWVTGMIFLQMRRLQSEGTLVISNAVGQVGTVYLTIPEKGSGVITVSVQGAQRTLDAVSEHGQRIPTGSMVRVVAVAAGKLIVTEHTSDPQ